MKRTRIVANINNEHSTEATVEVVSTSVNGGVALIIPALITRITRTAFQRRAQGHTVSNGHEIARTRRAADSLDWQAT